MNGHCTSIEVSKCGRRIKLLSSNRIEAIPIRLIPSLLLFIIYICVTYFGVESCQQDIGSNEEPQNYYL